MNSYKFKVIVYYLIIMSLLIFYLTDNRREFTFKHYIDLLNESIYKDKWKIIILTSSNNASFYKNILDVTNINHSEYVFCSPMPHNYLEKVNFAINYAKENDFPYMMKCDNDIFIRGRTLDYMIDNLYLLEDSNNLTIGPTISNGIPTVEYFSKQFLSDNEINILEKYYLQTIFWDLCGEMFSKLNQFTLYSDIWDIDSFLIFLNNNYKYYKGIHPIRFNEDANKYLNSCIINNKKKFYDDKELSIIKDNSSPYLCNNLFCIKTNIYEKIINDKDLYIDAFDEVPLNRYNSNNNLNHIFIKNGFGIHMYYNFTNNYISYEKEFVKDFFT